MHPLPLRRTLPVFILSLSVLACGGKKESEPDPDTDPGNGNETETEVSPELLESRTFTLDGRGGSLSFTDGAELQLPPGALDAPTELTASRWKVPVGEDSRIEYRFEPLGTTFMRPATLTLPLPPVAARPEGRAIGFSPSLDGALPSLGRIPDGSQVSARIVETGRASVITETALRDVVGVALLTHHLSDGSRLHVPGGHLEGPLVLRFTAEDGSEQERTTELSAQGTFRFRDVPVGDYALHLNHRDLRKRTISRMVIGSVRSALDLGRSTALRPGALPDRGDDAFSLTAQSPQAVDWTDRFQVVSTATNRFAQYGVDDEEAPGTSFPLLLTTQFTDPFLLDAQQGDVLTVVRQARLDNGSTSYRSAVERAQLRSVTQATNMSTSAFALLTPFSETRSAAFSIHTGAFTSPSTGMNACEPIFVAGVLDAGAPIAPAEAPPLETESGLTAFDDFLGPYPSLVEFGTEPDFWLPQLDTGTLTYGSDSTSGDHEFFTARSGGGAPSHRFPGTTSGVPRNCERFTYRATLADAQSGTLQPRILPPAAFLVNGQEGVAPYLTVPSGAVVLEWNPPAEGDPTGYRLRFQGLAVDGNQTATTGEVLEVLTEGTLWVLPAGTFTVGPGFSVDLEVHTRDPAAPLREPLLGHSAAIESGLIHLVE